MKTKQFGTSKLIPCLLITLLFIGVFSIPGCSNEAGTTPAEEYSGERAREIAEEYIKNSPTFHFDGIEDTLIHIESISLSRCQYCWGVVYEFDSRQAGYGDRAGQILAQVITPHRVVMTLNRNIIESAVMDEKWDMMKQEMIQEDEEPFETICVGELLAEPVYDTEVMVQGKVSLLGQLKCPCFELTSCGETVTVWYDLMIDDEVERPTVSVAGIKNGDTVAVTGELKDTTGDGGTFWASKIEFLY